MELTKNQKLVFYVIGMLDELKKMGILKDGAYELSGKGVHCFDELISSKYRPSLDEITEVIISGNLVTAANVYYIIKVFEKVDEVGLFAFKDDFEGFLKEGE